MLTISPTLEGNEKKWANPWRTELRIMEEKGLKEPRVSYLLELGDTAIPCRDQAPQRFLSKLASPAHRSYVFPGVQPTSRVE